MSDCTTSPPMAAVTIGITIGDIGGDPDSKTEELWNAGTLTPPPDLDLDCWSGLKNDPILLLARLVETLQPILLLAHP